jgi:Tfp pilus assembly protein PilF
MRSIFMCLVATLPLAACATQPGPMVETGYPRGSLAVAAIDRGDYARAEQLLEKSVLGRDDPALLINLGQVYMAQGKHAEAMQAWRSALAVPLARDVEIKAGHTVRTDQLARELIARHQRTAVATR